ncbi:SDR family oxidoreductase [Sphingobium phenoxybenzoativorans]|uniref:SDR family oxidoreductase n=1 Tax=Sphingobium phenoxybenzoativorans TaxID=1592790 RepID=A0A975Q2R1_9SPHN|nr:SDR family NAD(P)-dependent oxidoreductase [Sphingobium phenoxybenzoativorans]QUT06703.1 SDR family oxidoreductase [Sphingobium phenoxybenzoativorans]
MKARKKVSTGRLAGRKILITGGNSGIGAAAARRFVKEGALVTILGRDPKTLAEVSEETGAYSVTADLFDPVAATEAVDEAFRLMNGMNGLVCNAGVSLSRPFADTSLEDWHWAMDGNATSIYLTCHAALPYLRRNDAATIVNVGSAVALSPLSGRAAYSASKAAVHAFTKVLAMELAPRIRCNIVSPGAVDTPMVRETFTDPAQIKRIENLYAVRRMGQPDEIVEAILFLTSFESSFVTGTTLSIDGGRIFY